MPELSISKDKIDFLVTKAREFAGRDVAVDPGDASNPTDAARYLLGEPLCGFLIEEGLSQLEAA